MTKQGLALIIIIAALRECDNHVLRLKMINRLADKNCLPRQFRTIENKRFWFFTVAGCDFYYQDEGTTWFVKPAISQYVTMKQHLELT